MACFPKASSSTSYVAFRRCDRIIILCERCLIILKLPVGMYMTFPSGLVCVAVEGVGEVGGVIEYAKPWGPIKNIDEVDNGGVGVNNKISRL